MSKEMSSSCSWCGEQIEVGQPTSYAFDGELMHFGCACEADDIDDFKEE